MKYTKKQKTILENFKLSIQFDMELLQEYKDKGDTQMFRFKQDMISDHIQGVNAYLIYAENKNWHVIRDAIHEIRDCYELSAEAYLEVLELSHQEEK